VAKDDLSQGSTGIPSPSGSYRGGRPGSANSSRRPSSAGGSSRGRYSRPPSSQNGFASARKPPGSTGPVDLHNQHQSLEQSLDATRKLISANTQLIRGCEKLVVDAKANTERHLQDRINEIHNMMKRIEVEVLQTKQKQQHTRELLAETRTQMDSLVEPMKLCATHQGVCHGSQQQQVRRKQVGALDCNSDPVEKRLNTQKDTLLRTTQELRSHRQTEKSILTELADHMERLKEDLREKTMALDIDVHCLSQAKSNAFMTQGRFT